MAKWIAAVSGKGGTGKSTVTAGLSRALARLGCRTLAVDLDVGLRSLDLMLGVENRVVCDLGDVLSGQHPAADAVIPAAENLCLLCGPSSPEALADRQKLCALLRETADPFEYAVLDLPAGLGLSIELALELAELAAVVTLPDLVAMRDARLAADALLADGSLSCRLIINQVGRDTMRAGGLKDLDELLDGIGIQLFGVVPWDPCINSRSLARRERSSPLTEKVFDAMAQRVTGRYVPIRIKTV